MELHSASNKAVSEPAYAVDPNGLFGDTDVWFHAPYEPEDLAIGPDFQDADLDNPVIIGRSARGFQIDDSDGSVQF